MGLRTEMYSHLLRHPTVPGFERMERALWPFVPGINQLRRWWQASVQAKPTPYTAVPPIPAPRIGRRLLLALSARVTQSRQVLAVSSCRLAGRARYLRPNSSRSSETSITMISPSSCTTMATRISRQIPRIPHQDLSQCSLHRPRVARSLRSGSRPT